MQNGHSIDKSQQSGFYKLWSKFEGYEIADNQIKGNGIIYEFNAPMGYSELPNQVARLKNKKEKDLLKFVQAYGLLGYKKLNTYADSEGEPLNWIWAHAQGIYLVIELMNSLQNADFETIIKILKPYEVVSDKEGFKKFMFEVGDKDRIIEEPYSVPTLNQEYALLIAKHLIQNLINRNTTGINTEVYSSINLNNQKKNLFNLRYNFTAMIEVVYWQLLNAAVGGEFRRCKNCNTSFIVVHGSNEYCPKKEFEKESLCAINYRQKERRKKLKQLKE